jgi:hypothetical protein
MKSETDDYKNNRKKYESTLKKNMEGTKVK